MRFSPRTWSLLSLLLFIGAIFFWLKGNEYEEARRKKAAPPAVTNTPARTVGLNLLSTGTNGLQLAQLSSNPATLPDETDKLYPNRLRNTPRHLSELIRDDHAILLANALIDTASGKPLNIPAHLRSKGAPGSYIVQWNGPATAEFRERLAEAGATIVSYVPNNAYFVKVAPEGARLLQQTAGVQAVLPFEPYYKLQRSLLAGAVNQELLPADAMLRLTLLPGARDDAVQSVKSLGAQIVAEEPSPFGPQIVLHPPVDALVSLAALADVQAIELERARKPAADLSRVALGIASDTTNTSNYLNLTGSNIWVNINDTGIDTTHPALSSVPILLPPAPIPMAGSDSDGHGTFVASLIAGSGAQSPDNVPGSLTNASFRGMAPGASLIALPLKGGGGTNGYPALNEKVLDSWLIESAARTNYLGLKRTNSLISNNSWTYGQPDYDSAAARYDSAVRDAIPGLSNSQPVLFVFAAGNSGFGNDEGHGAQADSIESPGTAKNVITVGAVESLRLITNIFTVTTNIMNDEISGLSTTNYTTNYPFAASTDTTNQVAAFSSRGNVGIGLEGTAGRFKPDVVAPGTFLVGARSRGWNYNGVDTNDNGFGQAYFNLHTNLQQYRFDNGTTFAAANVSGLLALVQQYFEWQGPTDARGPLSPALMKALLINGARSISSFYDLSVKKTTANDQGWGLPNLPNMLSSYSTNAHSGIDQTKWRLRTIEQSPTNALATGQSRTWNITLSSNALTFPFRVTLAWTDPPGNPSVGIKLVNDLDLIVTNLDTGSVFYGNDIPVDADFNNAVIPPANGFQPVDSVNNVENVAIRNPKQFGQNFSITVRGHRVNVNALPDYLARTGNTNDVVQDFALVVSSEMGADPSDNDFVTYLPDQSVFDTFDTPTFFATNAPATGILTNGLPLLQQRVGANATLIGTNGLTNQWRFYTYTNIAISNELVNAEAGPYVAFITFDPPELSIPRNQDSDIDIYVSKNPALTNLDPTVISAAFRSSLSSLDRGGSEMVVITNATVGDIFYIGVKSEDQQASEFSLMGVSSAGPFQTGNRPVILHGVPLYASVPDGTARRPVAGTLIAIGVDNRRIAHVRVQTTIDHQDPGDLVGILTHNNVSPILYNHRFLNPGRTNLGFNDNGFSPLSGFSRSDGPGSLSQFAGYRIQGPWLFQWIDNTPSHTGRVESLTITIDPLQDKLVSGRFFTGSLSNNETAFFPIDVGPGVTNLSFTITNNSKLEVFFRQLQVPDTNAFDFFTNSLPPGIKFSFPATTNDAPLAPGTSYIAIQNTNNIVVRYGIMVEFGFGNIPGNAFDFTGAASPPADAATTNTTIFVPNDKVVASAQVSLYMDYPRMSDLAVSLISPQGTRVLLAENRGGTNNGYGAPVIVTNTFVNPTNHQTVTTLTTNIAYTVFTDDTNIAQIPIKFATPILEQNRTNIGLVSSNNFETGTGGWFPGDTVEGLWTAVGTPDIINSSAAAGKQALEFTGAGTGFESGITEPVQTIPGQTYKVSFASRRPGKDYLYWTERFGSPTGKGTNFLRRLQLGTGAIQLLTNSVGTGAYGGVSIDSQNGYVYSGDLRSLFRTDLLGQNRTNLVVTQNAVTDVELDPANNWIYWAESGPFTRTNSIKRVRPNGKGVETLLQLLTGVQGQIELLSGQINGIALDAAQNKLYFTFSFNLGPDSIQVIDLATHQRRVIAVLPQPSGGGGAQPTLTSARNGTNLVLSIGGTVNENYVVETSTNLTSWSRFATVTIPPGGVAEVTVPITTLLRLFRVRTASDIAGGPVVRTDPFDIDFDPETRTLIFNEPVGRSFWQLPVSGSPVVPLFTNAVDMVNGFALNGHPQEVFFNSSNTIYSRTLTATNLTALARGLSTVHYEEVAHGIQATGGTNEPLSVEVIFGNITNNLPGTAAWTSNSFYFVGTGETIPVTIQAVLGTVDIDNVVIERVADTFVLPEEPLAPLIGERSIGQWTLQVQDTRTGAAFQSGSFDWRLDLQFADPLVFAETLTGGSRFSVSSKSTINPPNRLTPGILYSNDVHYFIIQPCLGAQNITVMLGGVRNFDAIEVLADISGIPTGNPETDDFVPMENNQNPNSGNGVLQFKLSSKLTAPAHLPANGLPFFIALRNRFQDDTNVYNLFVTSDGNCPPIADPVSVLVSGQPQVSALSSASDDYSANQMGLHAFGVPAGAQAVKISVDADAEVTVLAQKDEPPTTDSFAVMQNVPGASHQELTLTTSSSVPITPGLWYVRVLNNTPGPISYTIDATGDLTDPSQLLDGVQLDVPEGQGSP